jgi:hypothetical protein
MGDFGKDITSIVTLLIGVALVALLVGHAAGTGSLISASASGLNELLATVELESTASNTPYTPQSGSSAFGNISVPGISIGG